MRQVVLVCMLALLNAAVVKGQEPFKGKPVPLKSIHPMTFVNVGKGNASTSLQKLISEHKRIILNFVSSYCSYSRQQLDSVERVLQSEGKRSRQGKNSIPIVLVFVDRSLRKIHQTLRETSLPSLVVWDKGRTLSKKLKVKVTPTIVVIDQNAKPIGTYEGFPSSDPKAYQDFLTKLIQAVVKGLPLPPRPIQFHISSSKNSCTPSG